MYGKCFLCLILVVALTGCGTSRQTIGGSVSGTEDATARTAVAKVVETEERGWVLVDPDGVEVAAVYVQMGSTRPDQFQNGMIRIVDAYGKIGFANEKGIVVIPPYFVAATCFKGPVAAVAPASDGSAVTTDNASSGLLTGNELWGVIGKDGRYLRNPVFRRSWNEQVGDYVYSSPTSKFWLDDQGELHGF